MYENNETNGMYINDLYLCNEINGMYINDISFRKIIDYSGNQLY